MQGPEPPAGSIPSWSPLWRTKFVGILLSHDTAPSLSGRRSPGHRSPMSTSHGGLLFRDFCGQQIPISNITLSLNMFEHTKENTHSKPGLGLFLHVSWVLRFVAVVVLRQQSHQVRGAAHPGLQAPMQRRPALGWNKRELTPNVRSELGGRTPKLSWASSSAPATSYLSPTCVSSQKPSCCNPLWPCSECHAAVHSWRAFDVVEDPLHVAVLPPVVLVMALASPQRRSPFLSKRCKRETFRIR